MIKIKLSYETNEEKRLILEALDPIIEPKSVRGYKSDKPFQRAYITAKIKTKAS